jgi:hypothetical protein
MRETRKIVTDYETEVDAYVDEDDYVIDCDGIDDTEMSAVGRCLRQQAED